MRCSFVRNWPPVPADWASLDSYSREPSERSFSRSSSVPLFACECTPGCPQIEFSANLLENIGILQPISRFATLFSPPCPLAGVTS